MKGKEGAESGEDEAESGGARGEEEKCRRKDKGLEETGRSRRERSIRKRIDSY